MKILYLFKTYLKKVYIINFLTGVITPILVFSMYSFFSNRSQALNTNNDNLEFITIEKTDIKQTIKVVGNAELVNEQKLRFNQIGKIAKVNFKDSDTIKKNQVIAELDKSEIYNDIKQAEINLNNSQLSLQELLKGNTESQILKAKININNTKQSIEMIKRDIQLAKKDERATIEEYEKEIEFAEKDVTEKKDAINIAKRDIENTEIFEKEDLNSTNNTYNSTLKEAMFDIKDSIIKTDDILSDIDTILGQEESTKNLNDSFENNLGAANTSTKTAAITSYQNCKKEELNVEDNYNNLNNKEELSVNEIIALGEQIKSVLQYAAETADNTYLMLENSISDVTNLTQSDLSSYKSSMASNRSSALSSINTIQNTITSLKNLEDLSVSDLRSSDTLSKKQDSLRSVEYALEKAENTLNTLKNTFEIKKESKELESQKKENELTSLNNTLKTQEEDLKELQKGATDEQITQTRNNITQKELALSKVKSNTDKYELIAPFDGIIRKIDFKVGDNLLADEDKFVYLENPNLLKITIMLDQIDIVKVDIGDTANIKFDALPEKTFTGQIEEINQTPVIESGVVSYEANLTLNKETEKIFSGMTSSVEIIANEKTDILAVPNLSIISKDEKNYVKKQTQKGIEEIEIITGISDGKNTEIIKGLSEGDQIVKVDYQVQTKGQENNNTNPMQQMMRATRSGGGH